MGSYLQDILGTLSVEHSRALLWFQEHEGEVGPRPWRDHGSSVIPGVSFPVVAQRGIHQPSGWDMAISVTATSSEAYCDGDPQQLGDGTWALPYFAHSGGDGSGIDSRWNRALLNNWSRRIPVGVFVQKSARAYRNMGLAFVEDCDLRGELFHLRGPVMVGQGADTWARSDSVAEGKEAYLSAQTVEEDDPRTMAMTRTRRAQGTFRSSLLRAYQASCAITGYDAEQSLEAAHILAYSGARSQQPQNGLLLRADLHLLFDRYLFSIEPDDSRVWLSPELKLTRYRELDGKTLRLPRDIRDHPDVNRLRVHWEVFRETERSQQSI